MRRVVVFCVLLTSAQPLLARETVPAPPSNARAIEEPQAPAGWPQSGQPAAAGYHLTNHPGEGCFITQNPTNEDIAKAVLKGLAAALLHEASKKPGTDLGDEIARALARAGRDELIKSALKDLVPRSTFAERASVQNLIILILDGRLNRNRDQVINQLRSENPNMANAVEIAEFLIRLNQTLEQNRRR